MDAFPAVFPLSGRRVVVAGSGEAADTKARLFDGAPATLARPSRAEAVLVETYRGAVLAFVADADEAFIVLAAEAARAAGVPVNVVDHPQLCDFITPAIVDRGQVVAAVATNGAAPMLSAMLRNDLEAAIPEGTGRLAALLHRLRGELREALPDLAARRAFLRGALDGPAAKAALEGDMAKAEQLLRQALAGEAGAARTGRVWLIRAGGPADLLTLRASRALSRAEVLIADVGCDPGVVALARRDAHRTPAGAGIDHAVEAAREGLQVVWLIAGAPPSGVRDALAAAGVAVEVTPVAQD